MEAGKKQHEECLTTLYLKQECNEAANLNSGYPEKSTLSSLHNGVFAIITMGSVFELISFHFAFSTVSVTFF